jgi:hypothetical protein
MRFGGGVKDGSLAKLRGWRALDRMHRGKAKEAAGKEGRRSGLTSLRVVPESKQHVNVSLAAACTVARRKRSSPMPPSRTICKRKRKSQFKPSDNSFIRS